MSEDKAVPAGSYMTAFIVGALAGAGIALLYAPRSGKETRQLLADRARKLKGKAQEGFQEAKDYLASKREELNTPFETAKDGAHEEEPKRPRIL